MIYIYTSENDNTCSRIIEWLFYYKASFKRVNIEFFIDDAFHILENSSEVDFHLFWIWRSDMNFGSNNFDYKGSLQKESQFFLNYFLNSLKGQIINHPKNVSLDKITQLRFAAKIGLRIPKTIVTNLKTELVEFYGRYNNVISKSFNEKIHVLHDDHLYTNFTNTITQELLNVIPNNFFPSIFQEYIDSIMEVRVFYFMEEIYAYAFYSKVQNVDVRKSVNENNTFILPFELDEKYCIKIRDFMNLINLQTGSLDFLICKKSKEFVFLELNPTGQFIGYSEKCNLYLDKVIAEKLIYENKN